MRPPAISRLLLTFAAGADHSLFLAGDLEEEFGGLCRTRGTVYARQWYTRQARCSLIPLMAVRFRSLPARILTAVLTGAAPLLLLDRLWRAAYSQIPLKAGFEREPFLLGINLAVSLICVALQPPGYKRLTCLCIAAALWFSVASQPLWYLCAELAVAPCVFSVQHAVRFTRRRLA